MRGAFDAFRPPFTRPAPWLHPSRAMFFHSWSEVLRIVVVVAVLRFAGQQALAQMSGYDVIVTITLGSVVASVILTPTLTLTDALAAVVTLLTCNGSRDGCSRDGYGRITRCAPQCARAAFAR
jgi:hypothetical protein